LPQCVHLLFYSSEVLNISDELINPTSDILCSKNQPVLAN